MESPNGAKLEVTILIDKDQWEEIKSEGYSDKDIEQAIKQAITLKGVPFRSPVMEIDSIDLVKYY